MGRDTGCFKAHDPISPVIVSRRVLSHIGQLTKLPILCQINPQAGRNQACLSCNIRSWPADVQKNHPASETRRRGQIARHGLTSGNGNVANRLHQWHGSGPNEHRQSTYNSGSFGCSNSRVWMNNAFFSPGNVKSKPQVLKNSSDDVIAITSRILSCFAQSTHAVTNR